ncbi:MAG: VTT domain-containing protein [Bacilli bacterium]|nr:VTT domain-containing protein [Bacilli bacterium]MDD3304546.1 VTT domain-containing protein [Bacilli bacterium]MDD4053838.1 VTT domain-containing protein [Bacilli bacterium]MDD4411295.1 VTT domain-containing protein [Bacilli bacterium]
MVDILENIIEVITDVMRVGGPLVGFFLIILESILPILPLGAFIALNNIVFGSFWGFIISWVATIIGCIISFYAFRLGFSNILYRNIKLESKVNKFMVYMRNITLPQLTLLIAMPFTPAFAVNIAAGLSKMSVGKYLASIIIGKISIVYFWGYIGTSFIESIKDPVILLEIAALLGIAYVISRLIQKYLNMNGVK